MADGNTPSIDEVRSVYVAARDPLLFFKRHGGAGGEFDRALAEHDRELAGLSVYVGKWGSDAGWWTLGESFREEYRAMGSVAARRLSEHRASAGVDPAATQDPSAS